MYAYPIGIDPVLPPSAVSMANANGQHNTLRMCGVCVTLCVCVRERECACACSMSQGKFNKLFTCGV